MFVSYGQIIQVFEDVEGEPKPAMRRAMEEVVIWRERVLEWKIT